MVVPGTIGTGLGVGEEALLFGWAVTGAGEVPLPTLPVSPQAAASSSRGHTISSLLKVAGF